MNLSPLARPGSRSPEASLRFAEAAGDGKMPAPFAIEPVAPSSHHSGRLETYRLHSAILPEPDTRGISVYLPEAYTAEPARHFPVFYLHDGQNLFDPHTSYIPGRTWQADATADAMMAAGRAEPVILVGIANTGLRRMAEYTPTRDFRMGGGEGNTYGRLLREELKPFIDRTYRTRPEARHTALGGSSLGGLISLHLGLEHPEVFGKLAVMSPSIWWDHRAILASLSNLRDRPRLRIWLDIGTAEGQRHVRDTELLYRMLRQRGWQDDGEADELDLRFSVVAGAVHDEHAWAQRFDEVLAFLFPPVPASE